MIVVTFIISKKRGYGNAVSGRKRPQIWTAFKNALWGLLAPVIILGGIYGGMFTPTEAAAVAVVDSLLVDLFIYRSMQWKDFLRIAGEAGVTSSVIMTIVITASLFAWILNTQGLAAHGAPLFSSP